MASIKPQREKNSVSETGTVINWFISQTEFLGNVRIADNFSFSFFPHDKAFVLVNPVGWIMDNRIFPIFSPVFIYVRLIGFPHQIFVPTIPFYT